MKEYKYIKKNKKLIHIIERHIKEIKSIRNDFNEKLKNIKKEKSNIISLI